MLNWQVSENLPEETLLFGILWLKETNSFDFSDTMYISFIKPSTHSSNYYLNS